MRIQETLQGLLSRISLLRGTSLMRPERLPASLEEIKTLLACIQARDVAGARRTADLHLRNAEEAAVRVLAASLAASLADSPRAARIRINHPTHHEPP